MPTSRIILLKCMLYNMWKVKVISYPTSESETMNLQISNEFISNTFLLEFPVLKEKVSEITRKNLSELKFKVKPERQVESPLHKQVSVFQAVSSAMLWSSSWHTNHELTAWDLFSKFMIFLKQTGSQDILLAFNFHMKQLVFPRLSEFFALWQLTEKIRWDNHGAPVYGSL